MDKSLQMKDVQNISLDILKHVSKICEEQDFRYCLIYGTLIGAVRHQGFIPWDDDIDIMMPRPDYERFLEYAASHHDEMGYYEIFNCNTNKDYHYGITRVSDSRYVIIKENENNFGMGVFIDIYPYDGLGNDKAIALKKLCESRHICDLIADMIPLKWSVPRTLNIKGKVSYYLNMRLNRHKGINCFLNKISALRDTSTFDDSQYVGPLMWYFMKPESVCYEKRLFNTFIKMKFEDAEFFVPKEYDALLTQAYGDYMTPPPVEKRVYQHEYKAYKK